MPWVTLAAFLTIGKMFFVLAPVFGDSSLFSSSRCVLSLGGVSPFRVHGFVFLVDLASCSASNSSLKQSDKSPQTSTLAYAIGDSYRTKP
jgi:hypothetical protein